MTAVSSMVVAGIADSMMAVIIAGSMMVVTAAGHTSAMVVVIVVGSKLSISACMEVVTITGSEVLLVTDGIRDANSFCKNQLNHRTKTCSGANLRIPVRCPCDQHMVLSTERLSHLCQHDKIQFS